MYNPKNILREFWEYVEKQDTVRANRANRVYKWLNCNNLSGIIIDSDVFWIELKTKQATLPDYAFKYIRTWCNKQGYTYLYEKYSNRNNGGF